MIRSNGITTLADVINMSVGRKSENSEMYMNSDKEGQSGKCGNKQIIFRIKNEGNRDEPEIIN